MMTAFPPPPDAQVTLANWRTAPFSAWAFSHVREVVPSADIPNNPGQVRKLEAGDPLDEAALGLPAFCAENHVDGLVVLHKGRIVSERYADEAAPGGAPLPHILMSVSKSMLGLLAGVLADKGVLDLDASVESYLPELAGGAFAGATVHQLLDMRTGITFNEDYLLTEGPIVQYRKSTNWNPLEPGEAPMDLRGFLTSLSETDGPHGGRFDYKSPGTDLMGWVIERAAGARFADLFAQLIWQKAGFEQPAYITVDRLGAPRCAGGMCMTTRDLARVGQLLVEDGAGVIPKSWIDRIETDGDTDAWAQGNMAEQFPGEAMHYRAFWYVLRDRGPLLMGLGIHGQNLIVDRAAGLVLARHSSFPAPLDPPGKLRLLDLFERIRDRIS